MPVLGTRFVIIGMYSSHCSAPVVTVGYHPGYAIGGRCKEPPLSPSRALVFKSEAPFEKEYAKPRTKRLNWDCAAPGAAVHPGQRLFQSRRYISAHGLYVNFAGLGFEVRKDWGGPVNTPPWAPCSIMFACELQR